MPNLPTSTLESLLLTYALNALWQVPLIFAAASIAARASRRAGPAFQHTLWTTALLAEVLLPAISAELFQSAIHWLKHSLPPHQRSRRPRTSPSRWARHTPLLASSSRPHCWPPPHSSTSPRSSFFAIRLAIGLHQTASLRRRAQPLALTGYARQSVHRYAKLFAVPTPASPRQPRSPAPSPSASAAPPSFSPRTSTPPSSAKISTPSSPTSSPTCAAATSPKISLYQLLSLPIAFHPVAWLTRSRMAETRELLCDALAANAVAGPPALCPLAPPPRHPVRRAPPRRPLTSRHRNLRCPPLQKFREESYEPDPPFHRAERCSPLRPRRPQRSHSSEAPAPPPSPSASR